MRQELTTLLCALAMTTACSSDEAGPGDAFLGTWTTTTGTQSVIDCQFASKKENLSITYTVAKTDGADLQLTSSADANCTLKAKVVGQRATVLENQTCVRKEDRYEDTYKFATTSVLDMPQAGTGTIKLEATFKRSLDGLDTGFECGFTEEAPIKKQ
ncbi:MAG: hypothetical protein U0270_14855 [Labilithrix sp.]